MLKKLEFEMRNTETVQGHIQSSRTAIESQDNRLDPISENGSIKMDSYYFQNSLQNNKGQKVKILSSLKELKSKKTISEVYLPSCDQQNEENLNQAPKKHRSPFQNFQKHLVVTLKKEIKIMKKAENDCIEHLARRIWDIFLSSRKHSKKVLIFLFGVSTQSCHFKQSDIYMEFAKLSSVYPLREIELAQDYLRNEVFRQGRELLSMGSWTSGRRIEKSKQFQQYFQVFLCELEGGGVSRRISKPSKQCCLHMEQKDEEQK